MIRNPTRLCLLCAWLVAAGCAAERPTLRVALPAGQGSDAARADHLALKLGLAGVDALGPRQIADFERAAQASDPTWLGRRVGADRVLLLGERTLVVVDSDSGRTLARRALGEADPLTLAADALGIDIDTDIDTDLDLAAPERATSERLAALVEDGREALDAGELEAARGHFEQALAQAPQLSALAGALAEATLALAVRDQPLDLQLLDRLDRPLALLTRYHPERAAMVLAELGAELREAQQQALDRALSAFDRTPQPDYERFREVLKRFQEGRPTGAAHDSVGRTALHRAAAAGDLVAVEAALAAGGLVTARAHWLATPLHAAAAGDHAEVVRRLRAAGARCWALDAAGLNPLGLAARQGALRAIEALRASGCPLIDEGTPSPLLLAANAATVKVLVAAGAPLEGEPSPLVKAGEDGRWEAAIALVELGARTDLPNRGGRLPLHEAVYQGRGDVARRLIALGLDPDRPDSLGATTLDLAAEAGRWRLFIELLGLGAAPREAHVGHAARAGAIAALEALAAAGVPLSGAHAHGSALAMAALGGQLEATRWLLDKGAAPNVASELGETPLDLAARDGHRVVVEVLLEAGAKPTARALVDAARGGHTGVVRVLLGAGLAPDARPEGGYGRGALHEAEDVELARLLLARGADVNLPDRHGDTPLHRRCKGGPVEVAQLLLSRGADATLPGAEGRRCLQMALDYRQLAVGRALIAHGVRATPQVLIQLGHPDKALAMLEARRSLLRKLDERGRSPLHHAAAQGLAELVQSLLALGADPDVGLGVSYTPLHVAANEAVAKVLIAAGADVDARAVPTGDTPLHTAWRRRLLPGGEDLSNLIWALEDAGADQDAENAKGERPRDQGVAVANMIIPVAEWGLELDFLMSREALGTLAPLGELVIALVSQRRFREAQPVLEDLIREMRIRRGPSSREHALLEHDRLRLRHYMGQYDGTIEGLERVARRLHQRPGEGTALASLGQALAAAGRYQEAEARLLASLALRRSDGRESDSRMSLGELYLDMGRYGAARAEFEAAHRDRETRYRVDHPKTLAALANLAATELFLGRYEVAREHYARLLEVLAINGPGRDPSVLVAALNNLGEIHRRQGRWEQAQAHYDQAIHALTSRYEDPHPNEPRIRLSVGELGLDRGDAEAAKRGYAAALKSAEALFGSPHAVTAEARGGLGAALSRLGQSDEAGRALTRALAEADAGEAPEVRWRVRRWLANHLARVGRPEGAIFFGKQALAILAQMRQRLKALGAATQHSFLVDREAAVRELAERLVVAGRLGEAEQALALLKRAELRELGVVRGEAEGGLTPNAAEAASAERMDKARGRIAAIGRELAALRARDELSDAERAREGALRKELRAANKVFEVTLRAVIEGLGAETARAEAARLRTKLRRGLLRRLAKAGAGQVAAVHYLIADDHLHVLVTTSEVRLARRVEVSEAALNRRVHRARRALQSPWVDPREAMQGLHALLVAPIAADLEQAGVDTLMVSLDGALRYVPMAALHDGERWLVERYRLAVLAAAASDGLTAARQDAWRVAGFGLTRAIDEFGALPGVAAELAGVVAVEGQPGALPGVVKLDQEFDRAAVREALRRQYPVLHLASHFAMDAGAPAESFLLLGDGGRLSLREMQEAGLDFGDLDLVTLSACSTGVGGDGREVEGMGALVLEQGALSVVATLWPVSDHSTSKLMRALYAGLARGDNKAEALRQAQLALIRGEQRPDGGLAEVQRGLEAFGAKRTASWKPDPKAPWGHPYYWAPVLLIGNWR